MKKKLMLGLVLILSFAFALAACGGGGDDDEVVVDTGSVRISVDDDDVDVDVDADADVDEESAGDYDFSGDAYDIYEDAVERLLWEDGFEYDLTIEDSASISGTGAGSRLSGHVIQVDPSGDLQMEMVFTTEEDGDRVNTTSYYKDGYQYVESDGDKIKYSVDADDMQDAVGEMPEFDADEIGDQSVTETDDGATVSFTVDAGAIENDVNAALEGIKGLPGTENIPDIDIDTGDAYVGIKVTATLDSWGNLTELVVEETSYAGSVEATSVTKLSNIEIGEFEIDFPSDLDEYEEW
ncbi:MAG: hypothetical protein LBR44_01595 [Clostridiales Family XIII bacterium]|jgi:hypothetical protein|nr:hypothetical protein [Clostridiales Family XIII bacterium]